jgi:hypothetical protein
MGKKHKQGKEKKQAVIFEGDSIQIPAMVAQESTETAAPEVQPEPLPEFKPETETFMHLKPTEEKQEETQVKEEVSVETPPPVIPQRFKGKNDAVRESKAKRLAEKAEGIITAGMAKVASYWERALVIGKLKPDPEDKFRMSPFDTQALKSSLNHLEKYLKGISEYPSDATWDKLKNKSIVDPAHIQSQIIRMREFIALYGAIQ